MAAVERRGGDGGRMKRVQRAAWAGARAGGRGVARASRLSAMSAAFVGVRVRRPGAGRVHAQGRGAAGVASGRARAWSGRRGERAAARGRGEREGREEEEEKEKEGKWKKEKEKEKEREKEREREKKREMAGIDFEWTELND